VCEYGIDHNVRLSLGCGALQSLMGDIRIGIIDPFFVARRVLDLHRRRAASMRAPPISVSRDG
jgi:hypothetical protein